VLVTIDTLRADHLPAYGATDRLRTPAISQLARDGVLFQRAYSAVPLTLPSHTTILTGLLPFHHGVRDNGGFYLDPRRPTLATVLQQQGYHTAAFVSAFVLDSRWGLARGFDEYYDHFDVTTTDLAAMARVQRPGGETWTQARAWLQAHATDRFFLWIHLFDPHAPYEPPEPFRTEYADRLYDGEIAYDDAIVGNLLAELTSHQLLDKTVVAVLSDHGEGLGEHGEDEHGLLAFDSTLRVPWIVRLPDRRFAGTRVDEPVGLVDVMPTLLDVIGISAPHDVDGTSRTSSFRAPGSSDVLYAETMYPRLHFGWSELQSVRNGRYKAIRGRRTELYDYRADPNETTNLADREPDVAARLGAILDRMAAGPAQPAAAPDADAASRLKALGYFSGSATAPTGGNGADPRDKTSAYRLLTDARRQLDQGHAAEGVRSFERLLAEEPEMDVAHRTLREYWIEHGQFEVARTWLQGRLTSRAGDPRLIVDLATVERAARRPERALALLEPLVARDKGDIEALMLDGELLRDAGRLDLALERFEAAVRLQPDDTTARMQAANTLFAMHRIDDTEAAARTVLARDPHAAGAHYLLAQTAEARGDIATAEREYRNEMAQSPWDYRGRFNLAMLLGRRSAFDEELMLLESIPKLAPGFHDVYFFLAKARLDTGNPSQIPRAIEDANRGLALAPTSASAPLGHYVLADIYRLQGRSSDAERELLQGRALEQRLAGRGAS